MELNFPVDQTVKERYSVRTYEDQPLTVEAKKNINAYIATLSNPFSINVSFCLLESKTEKNAPKLGTYGVIKGATDFIGATVVKSDFSLEALGYSFEKLILYATSLGLGTCWLGGTFNRSEFTAAMCVKKDELFPCISPVGYPAAKKRLAESIVRKIGKMDQRKTWSALFFNNDFSTPLVPTDAGVYTFPLEMLRLSPSASNKQPWRIVRSNNTFHFYEAKTPGYSDKAAYDIQRVDIGISACHFHLAAIEKGLTGNFVKQPQPNITVPEHSHYIFSWVPTQN